MKTIPSILTSLVFASLSASALETTPELLLAYPFSEGSALVASDEGPHALHLQVSPAWSWGVSGSGVGGGPALGRTGDMDISIENEKAADSGLDGLVSYTLCGWYKLEFNEKHTGVLFELVASEGNGFQVHFSSKPEGTDRQIGPWQHALVAVVGPTGINPHTGEGVRYSRWENPFARVGEWIFFAVTVDTTRSDNHFLRFYAATEGEQLQIVGQYGRTATWSPDFTLGRIVAIGLGNSSDLNMPVPVGTYFNEFRFYGSADGASGALSVGMLEDIRHSIVEKRTAALHP